MIIRHFVSTILRRCLSEHQSSMIKIYHGTPFKSSANGIRNNGLQQVGDFLSVGGDGSPSMQNRSYVAKELWNVIRYSFMMPSSLKIKWAEFIKKEPYSFVFEFNISIDELLPDEGAIGQGVCDFLNGKGNEFYKKYLANIDKALLKKTKQGYFNAFAQTGKIIEPMLTDQDKVFITRNTPTATVDKPIYPTKTYLIKKPNVQFFKTKEEYIDWFNKNHKVI